MLLPIESRMAYARWWYACGAADELFQNNPEALQTSEDLGDYVEATATLRTFGPNPRGFDPPILPEAVKGYYGSREE